MPGPSAAFADGRGSRRRPPFSPETPREILPAGLGDRTAFIFFVLEAH